MATIDMSRKHSLSREDTRSRAEDLARSMEEKLGIRWHWEGDAIRFDTPGGAAKGTTGQVIVTANEVRVQIDLPLWLRALKGMVEGKVKERLEAVMGPGCRADRPPTPTCGAGSARQSDPSSPRLLPLVTQANSTYFYAPRIRRPHEQPC